MEYPMTKAREIPTLPVWLTACAMAVGLGITGTDAYILHGERALQAAKIASLSTQLRDTTQKLYDLQEGRDDLRDRMEGEYSVKLFELQQKLAAALAACPAKR